MAPGSVLIVGGGVAGLSTAWHLARRGGLGVTLLEREDGFGRHSSGKNAGILRTAAADPVEVELAARGARFLQGPPPGFAPDGLVRRCGLVLAAGAGGAGRVASWIDRSPGNFPVEELSPAALGHRAPHYAGEAARAWLFPEEGRLDITSLIEAYASGARDAGATLETGREVRSLTRRGARVTGVELSDGERLSADALVLATGGWAGRMGAAAGSRIVLRPTRRHLLVTVADERADADWPVVWGVDDAFYVRPERGGLLFCACDETDVEPDAATSDPRVAEHIRARAALLVPSFADLPAERFWFGLRTFSQDGRFVVGWDPDVPGLFWVGGLGGAGMVTSPEVGRLAAATLAGDAVEPHLAQALSPRRFPRA